MLLDANTCYTALQARDSRFDGRFFFGVTSTGIYCRPVCRARTPKEENCSFYASAAAAEASGFRPCLRCRPELAPGLARVDAEARLARLAAQRMEADGLSDQSIAELADSLGVTDRHLRRVFAREYGVAPIVWLQTQRLLTAKQLLTETSLPIMQVAMDAGFGSVRRLNTLFRKQYDLTPADFRRSTEIGNTTAESVTLSLAYRPPFAWDTLLKFLVERAIPGVEQVESSRYRRTVAITHKGTARRGWISVTNCPDRCVVAVTLSSSLFSVINQVLARVRFLFDLNCMPTEIQEKLGSMQIGEERVFEHGLRLPGCFDPFEMSVRAILGQQITVQAARTLAMRIAVRLGEPIQTPFKELTVTFPTVERICALEQPVEDHLGPLGVTGARARSIRSLAEALRQGAIRLGPGADPEREMTNLSALPGFGPWTVQYLAMRALGWPDAFPHTDYGVKKALGNLQPKEILALALGWAPWRSYATLSLWNHLRSNNSGSCCKGEQAMKRKCSIQTPLGEMNAMVEQNDLCGLWFVGQKHAPEDAEEWLEDPNHPVFSALRGQLDAYFTGQLRAFDVPLAPKGTAFQMAVWALLRTIPAGTTTTYGALARQLAVQCEGRIPSAQAVGGAVGHNPIAIVIPCHRVVGVNGSLTGYAGGLGRKAALLALENGQNPALQV